MMIDILQFGILAAVGGPRGERDASTATASSWFGARARYDRVELKASAKKRKAREKREIRSKKWRATEELGGIAPPLPPYRSRFSAEESVVLKFSKRVQIFQRCWVLWWVDDSMITSNNA